MPTKENSEFLDVKIGTEDSPKGNTHNSKDPDTDAPATTLAELQRQRIRLREFAFRLSATVIVLAVVLEGLIVCRIVMPSYVHTDSNLLMVLVIAPIASITSIVIFLLIGVFRGYRERDVESLPPRTVTDAARAVGSPE